MRRRYFVPSALSCVGLLCAACATQEQKIAAASQIAASDDQFLPYREYMSGIKADAPAFMSKDAITDQILLGRVDKKTGAKTFAVQVGLTHFDDLRRRYKSARNIRAEEMKIITVRRINDCDKKSGCTRKEIITVPIPETDLRGAGPDGYHIKFFAQSGHADLVTIAKSVIASLLSKVDADPAAAAKTSAAQ